MIKSFEEFNSQRTGFQTQNYSKDPALLPLVEASMSMATEVNEIIENIRNAEFRGEPVDRANIMEEVGDLMWIVGELITRLDLDFTEILNLNQQKLALRYKDGLTPEESKYRDKAAERQIFEDAVKHRFDLSESHKQ